jgi:hypothetical protein
VDAFLSSRGFRPGLPAPPDTAADPHANPISADKPRDFICEDDVREAMKSGKKLLLGDRTIVTPSARELGESHKVFVLGDWPRG